MGTSRHRKNHKKKLQAYKNRMGQRVNTMNKLYQEAMKKQLELLIEKENQAKESGLTENFVEE